MRIARALLSLLDEVNIAGPNRNKDEDLSDGGVTYLNRPSDHNPCICHRVTCAIDITHAPFEGFDAHEFADWLATRLRNGQEGRIKYLISQGQICSGPKQNYRPGIWREYKGIDQHNTHVHVSVAHPSGVFDDPGSWGWEVRAQVTSI